MHELITEKRLSITSAAKEAAQEMNVGGTDPIGRLRKKYNKYLELLKNAAAAKRAAEQASDEGGLRLSPTMQDAIEAARYRSSPEFKQTLAAYKRNLRDPAYRRALAEIKQLRESGLLRDAVALARSIRKPK